MAPREWFQGLFRREPEWCLKQSSLVENTARLPNPAIGWYRIYHFPLEVPAETQQSQWVLEDGEQLALLLVNIGAFQRRELEDEALCNLRRGLSFFRQAGKELIVRGVYDSVGRGVESEPAQFERVRQHLRQLAGVIGEFQDTVFVYQGMLLGSWGEMHSSRFLSSPRMKTLLEILEKEIGPNPFLAVRRPMFYRMLRKRGQGEEARLGLYDDAIFGSDTDMGTFGWESADAVSWNGPWLPEQELAFEQQLCRRVPQGGEALLDPYGPPNLTDAVSTLHKMHITYLNSQYDPALLEIWKKQRWCSRDVWNGATGYDYIGAHLGYRFCVRQAAIRKEADGLQIAVSLENVGFAPLYQPCELRLLQITEAGEQHRIPLEGELRGLTAGERLAAVGVLREEKSRLYLGLYRKSDGRKICLGTDNPRQPENTKQYGLFLGTLEL